MTESTDSLLRGLPVGDPAYVRDHNTGMWAVYIFEPGTTQRLALIGTGMDKAVALWVVTHLKEAFARIPK